MKRNKINAFTLVEMLIVIVIIGILIAALMPRMQSAQWRARDVSRKTALSQIQSAIVTSQWDKWAWPKVDSWWTAWTWVNVIEGELKNAWMNSVPQDPLDWSSFSGLWNVKIVDWQYWYLVATRNGTPKWWFVLMAKTEVEWWSNWVVCESGTNKLSVLTWWILNSWVDISNITLCNTVTKITSSNGGGDCVSNTWACRYNNESELRYIMVY